MRTNLQTLGDTGSLSQAPGPCRKDTAVSTIPGLSPRSSSSRNSQAEERDPLLGGPEPPRTRKGDATSLERRHFLISCRFPQLRCQPEPLLSAPQLPPWNLNQSPSLCGDVPCISNTARCPGLTLLEACAGLLGMGPLSVGPRLRPVL